MKRQIDLAGATDPGKVREKNEDQFFMASLDKLIHIRGGSLTESDNIKVYGNTTGHLALVADGVGGSAHGEVASQLAAETAVQYVIGLMPWFFGLSAETEDDLMEHLESALKQCQIAIDRIAENQPGGRKMATTLTLAYALGRRLYIVHVGDSRCYVLRSGTLHQLTTDHTVAHRLAKEGAIAPAVADDSRFADVLYNVIGGGSTELEPEVRRASLFAGDTLLLCTDGLTDYADESTIVDILRSSDSAEEQCTALIDAAYAGGGGDNVTVVVGRVLER